MALDALAPEAEAAEADDRIARAMVASESLTAAAAASDD